MTYSARAPNAPSTLSGDSYARALHSALDPTIDVAPADRVGPLPRRRGRLFAVATVVLAGAGGTLWAVDGAARWPYAWAEASAAVAPAIERLWTAIRPPPEARATAQAADAAQPVRKEPAGPQPGPQPAVPSAERVAAAAPPTDEPKAAAAEPAGAEPAAPVERVVAPPPPVAAVEAPAPKAAAAAPADPLLRRAASAGLHAEISRLLLSRLSEEDFRNARTAIDTAVAETGDDEVHYWPKTVKAGRAQYQVHFVPHEAVAAGCRRYVVTIAKDGWATTALPVERCGVVRRAQQPRASDAKRAAQVKAAETRPPAKSRPGSEPTAPN